MNKKVVNFTKNKPLYRIIVKNGAINSLCNYYFVIFCYKYVEDIEDNDVWITCSEIRYNKLIKYMKKATSILPSSINLNSNHPLEIKLIRFRVERIDSFLL